MAHGEPCETAEGRQCSCACGGTGHASVVIAAVTSAATPHAQAVSSKWAAPRRWERLSKGGVPAGRTWSAREKNAAASATAEVVVVLVTDGIPSSQEEAIRRLADAISIDLIREVSHALTSRGVRSKVHGHFWCSVLAAICKVYDDSVDALQRNLDAAADSVMDALRSPEDATAQPRGADVRQVVRPRAPGNSIEGFAEDLIDEVLRRLIKKALRAITEAIRELGEAVVVKYVRIIGALVCPDPGAHPAVVRYCIWPLISGPLKDRISEDLRKWIGYEYLQLA